tara:strand:+ start:36638 stop:36904 length:267 start_codon:yes stop_codon:yes gene_type:complete
LVNPYIDKEGLRYFDVNQPVGNFVWHRDHEDRKITVLEGENWKFQYDNQLPVNLNKGDIIHVNKNEYHRIIKGDSNLVVKIEEKKNEI